jgi:hypothetical protein
MEGKKKKEPKNPAGRQGEMLDDQTASHIAKPLKEGKKEKKKSLVLKQ